MALLFLPGQLTARSDLYHQLAASLGAGLPLTRTVEILTANPPARHLKQPLARIHGRLKSGATLAEAFRSLGTWAPEFDIALIEAGEQSGRIDHAFALLARAYSDRAALARQIIAGIAYPAVVFHVAFLIMPIQHLVSLVQEGGLGTFLLLKLRFFLPVYALVALLVYAVQSSRGHAWRSLLESLGHLVPVLGRARRSLALARLSMALDALFNAGVAGVRAWPLAATASGSPALQRDIARMIPRIAEGEPPGDILPRCPSFPPHFTSIYASSELAGRIDQALPRLAQHYHEEGLRLMRIAAGLLTAIVYGAVMLVAAAQIIGFWLGHYNQILDV